MENKLYYLSTCSTCKRIISEVELPEDFPRQDIKENGLTESQVDELKGVVGSYEALFSRRAQLYRKRNLKENNLSETDYRDLLVEHYSFLKRPVFVIDDQVFVGNSPKTVAAVKEALHG